MNSTRDPDVRLHVAVKNRRPVQTQQQLFGAAEGQVGNHLELLDIEIRLIKAVEKHEAVNSRLIETRAHIRGCTEKRRKFHGEWNANAALQVAHQFNISLLNLAAAHTGVGKNRISIEFNGIGASLFHQLGVLQPTAVRDAVQAGDNRDIHTFLRVADQFEIAVWPEIVRLQVWEEIAGFRKALDATGQVVIHRHAFQFQLFLEERRQDYCADLLVFQAANVVHGLAE